MSAGAIGSSGERVRFGPYRLDRRQKLLFKGSGVVALAPKAYEMLDVLVRNAGQVVEKETLMKTVWPDTYVDEANLSHHVFTLRKVLGEDRNGGNRYIETIPRRGYRFVAEILRDDEPSEGDASTPAPIAVSPAKRSSLIRWLVPAVLVAALLGVLLFRSGRFDTAATRVERSSPAVASRAPRSIAVLPFRPLVAAQRDEPLELGMTDALINRLSSIRSIAVRPTSAVRRFAGLELDPLSAGKELGVDSVVEGSLQRAGDFLRVRVRLLNVKDGTALWADQFDERFTDIFALQDSISERVANALSISLTGAERQGLQRHPTTDPLAYDLYLKGRFFWALRTPEGIEKSLDYFTRATQRDPKFALGWVGVSDAHLLTIEYNGRRPKEVLPRAKAAVDKALSLDEKLAEAHVSNGVIQEVYARDWAAAEASYQKALSLNPNYATGHQWYGEFLMNMGRFDESIAEFDRALELDPSSLIINSVKGVALYLRGDYDGAARQLSRSIELDPSFARAHVWLGMVYQKQGRVDEARAELERGIALAGKDVLALPFLARAYAAAGRRDDAERVTAQLIEISRTRHVNGYLLAAIAVQLGDYDGAFHWLERAYEAYDNRLSGLDVDPDFEPIRGDKRYAALLKKLRLPYQAS